MAAKSAMPPMSSQRKLETMCQILAYLSPFHTPPPIGSPLAQTTCTSRAPASQVSQKVDGSKKSRIPRLKREKNNDSNSARKSRITKRSSKEPRRVTRCKGLRNSYQTCYQNSVFQCLLNMPEFVGYLDGLHNLKWCADHKAGSCVVCALKIVLRSYANGDSAVIPDKERDRLQKAVELAIPDDHPMAEDIKTKVQSDPFYFLRYVMQELQSQESIKSQVSAADLFDMETTQEWKCNECEELTTSVFPRIVSDGDTGFKVDILAPRKGLRLTTYLGHGEHDVKLEFRCESAACLMRGEENRPNERTLRKRITKVPEILVLQINRCGNKPNASTGRYDEFKIHGQVPFEEYINLGGFTESGTPVLYQLQGVVGHHGRSLHAGHYIAAVREPNGCTFCTINDEEVSQDRDGGLEKLYNIRSNGLDFDACVVFYSKV